jgi:radical SAM superfamily enzyme YgiQ (UPF0313 family)
VLVISANPAVYPDPVYPLGAAYVCSALAEAGHEVASFDCCFQTDFAAALCRDIEKFQPEVIGISMRNVDELTYPSTISFTDHYRALIAACRRYSKAPVVLGGSAMSLFPDEYARLLCPDYCIVGEGEQAMVELVGLIRDGVGTASTMHAGKLDIWESSGPDRRHFDTAGYYDRGGTINVQSKRGCRFDCSFCTFPGLEGRAVRLRDPVKVLDEIEALRDSSGIRDFFFVDCAFNVPESHALEICRGMIARSLRLRWTCYLRPSLAGRDLIAAMKEAGCEGAELGTESMSAPVLESMRKGLSIDEINEFCGVCSDFRLPFCHGIIFGMPGETRDTVLETVRNVEATRCTAAVAVVGVRVYKGTGLARTLIDEGYFDGRHPPGIDPCTYVSPGIEDWIRPFVENLANTNSRWIVPGFSEQEEEAVRRFRRMKKRGPAWLFKQMVNYL